MRIIILGLIGLISLSFKPFINEFKGVWYVCETQNNCVADSAAALYEFSDITLSVYFIMPDGLDPIQLDQLKYEVSSDTIFFITEDTIQNRFVFQNDSTLMVYNGADSLMLKKF